MRGSLRVAGSARSPSERTLTHHRWSPENDSIARGVGKSWIKPSRGDSVGSLSSGLATRQVMATAVGRLSAFRSVSRPVSNCHYRRQKTALNAVARSAIVRPGAAGFYTCEESVKAGYEVVGDR